MGKYQSEPITVLAIDYHRNGIAGTGFYVVLFTTPDCPRETMLAVSFECENAELSDYHDGEIAILSVEKLSDRNIEFGNGNSYRYEFFADEIKKTIRNYNQRET
jgi:hypothetical protein